MSSVSSLPNHHEPEERTGRGGQEEGGERRGKEQRIETPGRKANLREKQQGKVHYRDEAKRSWDGCVVSLV